MLTLFWGWSSCVHGDLGDAAEQCGRALAMAERTGDLVLQSRCLTYRAVAFRRLGDLARCSTEAEKNARTRHETRDGRIHRDGKSKPRVGRMAAARITRRRKSWRAKRSSYGTEWTIPTVSIGWRFAR